MTETEVERLGTSMLGMMEKLSAKMDLSNEEIRRSMRSMFTAEATVQRAEITAQADRVTKLETTLASMMGELKAIKGDTARMNPSS